MKKSKALRLGLAISATAMLAACAGSGQTVSPGSTLTLNIDCEGTARGLNYCLERAGKSCGAAGYTIVNSAGEMLSNSTIAASDMETLVKAYETDRNGVLVRCGS